MSSLKGKIQSLSVKYFGEIVALRRKIHSHPELSFKEKKTSATVCNYLKKNNIPYKAGIAGTGVIAWVTGTKENRQAGSGGQTAKVVALRAELDALPIDEQNDVLYRSKNKGVMHACGHDVHTASLLGAAKILNNLKSRFTGTVKLIFQPGEEKLPGGASMMIQEGALKDPVPAAAIAQHVFPFLDTGKVGFRGGKYMASTDEIYITVKGRGGHAALPKHNINPLLIASEIICRLNYDFMVPSTANIPEIPTVLAFGKIRADGATNVVPPEAFLEGTLRTFDEQWRDEAHFRIKSTAGEIATKFGGSCDVNIVRGYPFLVNDENLTARAKKYAVNYLGKDNVVNLDLMMTSEDFSYFSQALPSCFYRLGVRNEKKSITSPVHSPTFNVDEDALKTGMGLMAWIAINELKYDGH